MNFTEDDKRNLMAFLQRVDLKGAEAPTFLALCQKIMAPANVPATEPIKPELTD